MQARKLSGLCGLLLCIGAGCATEPEHIPLSPEQSQRISSSNGVILVAQKELVADIDKSNVARYTGGGLIPALIDVAIENSRASSAEESLKPVRNALHDFEMGKALREALGSRLDAIDWLHLKRTDIVYDNRTNPAESLLASGQEDVLLLITPTYALTADFSALRMEAEIRVMPRVSRLIAGENAEGDKKKLTPLYKTKLSQVIPWPMPGSDMERAAKAWAADGGKAIRQAMSQGVKGLADEIVEVLNRP